MTFKTAIYLQVKYDNSLNVVLYDKKQHFQITIILKMSLYTWFFVVRGIEMSWIGLAFGRALLRNVLGSWCSAFVCVPWCFAFVDEVQYDCL